MTPTPQHLLISFNSGIIGHMDGPVSDAKPLAKFEEEIQQRCESLGMGGKLLDAKTYEVLGEVVYKDSAYTYQPSAPEAQAKPRTPKPGR